MIRLRIVVPCYKCSNQIPRVLQELDSCISGLKDIAFISIHVIENNGNDLTSNRAKETISGLKNSTLFSVFKNRHNYGLGGTHKIAFRMAKAEQYTHLLVLHGDHQALPMESIRLISASRKAGWITTLGSRFESKSTLRNYSLVRILGNRFLNYLYSFFTGTRITDLGSGLNLFELDKIALKDLMTMNDDFTFNMDLLLYLVRNQISFQFEPISWQTQDQISNARTFQVGIKAMLKIFSWKFARKNNYVSNTEYLTELV